jgi:hypothetical protein
METDTMKKTLMIAAALMTFGVGAAFADGDVATPPAQPTRAPVVQTGAQQKLTFPVTHRKTVSIYSQINGGDSVGGGEN